MKKSPFLLLAISFIALSIFPASVINAQGVGINPSGNPPNSSAGVDIDFTNKGMLIPRMTTTQRDVITNPTQALQIYNLTTNCFEVWANGLWQTVWCAACPPPAQPSTISGSTSPCQGSSQSYSVTNVPGVTYTWTFPAGWTQTNGGTTNSVTVTVGSGSGNIQVVPSNIYCGNGTARTLAVTSITIPSAPTAGINTPSPTQIVWNWNTVSVATGYKYSTVNNYSNANDNGNSTSYTQAGLTCNTAYTLYVWSYNSCGNSSATTLTQTTSTCPFSCGSTLTDSRDGKTYSTVLIGSQCWMKQNLNYGTMINGSSEQTNNNIAEKYCNSDDNNKCNTYGGLYQWAEAVQYLNSATNTTSWSPVPAGNVQGLCPSGWHIPTDAEWCTLENTVEAGTDPGCNGIDWRGTNTGAKMKVTSGNTPPWDGANTTDFSALPGGNRESGVFLYFGTSGYFYSATEGSTSTAWWRNLTTGNSQSRRYAYDKAIGFSIRCLHD